jgi:hypothetical protein
VGARIAKVRSQTDIRMHVLSDYIACAAEA